MSDENKGPEVRFRHLDQEKWHEIRAQQHGDRRVSLYEKWLEFTPGCLSLHAKWDPGMLVRKHGHKSFHILYVLNGDMTCGDVRCTPGMHITLEQGASFGPFEAGPNGVELFEMMMGDPGSIPADPEGFKALLEKKGVELLPDPAIELPNWVVDSRKG